MRVRVADETERRKPCEDEGGAWKDEAITK